MSTNYSASSLNCDHYDHLFSGGSDDWAKGKLGIPYTYTIELPDTGRFGFLLPASRIEAVGREAFSGIQAMVRELVRSGEK